MTCRLFDELPPFWFKCVITYYVSITAWSIHKCHNVVLISIINNPYLYFRIKQSQEQILRISLTEEWRWRYLKKCESKEM